MPSCGIGNSLHLDSVMTGNLEYLIEPRNTTSRLLVPVLPSRNAHIQHSPSRPIQPTHLLHLHVARDSSGAGSALWARLGSKMVVIDQPHQTMWSWECGCKWYWRCTVRGVAFELLRIP